jgi:hypothetical protein
VTVGLDDLDLARGLSAVRDFLLSNLRFVAMKFPDRRTGQSNSARLRVSTDGLVSIN